MLVLSIKWYYDLLHFAVYDWLVLRMISFAKMVYLTGPSIFLTHIDDMLLLVCQRSFDFLGFSVDD